MKTYLHDLENKFNLSIMKKGHKQANTSLHGNPSYLQHLVYLKSILICLFSLHLYVSIRRLKNLLRGFGVLCFC